jgi:hypothetical protein
MVQKGFVRLHFEKNDEKRKDKVFQNFSVLLVIVGKWAGEWAKMCHILLGFDQYITVLTNDRGHNSYDQAVIMQMTADLTQRS